jgi:ribose transport system ATP-binding protein
VVYISHYLSEVFAIADRIEVLRDGRNAGSFLPAQAKPEQVLVAMLGEAVGNLYEGAPGRAGDVMLAVERLSVPGHFTDVSLDVRCGEIVGVFGLVGSGIEALGRSLFAASPRRRGGTVRVAGQPHDHGARGSVASGIGFVAGERKKEGIVGDLTVRENLTLPFLGRYSGAAGWMSRRREAAHARSWIERLGIRTRGPEQEIRTLSGGNQQKVCIARWLTEGVRLLILEEPTRGVDVGARRDIYRELRLLAAQGYAILMISSDVEEVAGLADRSFVFDRGRVAGQFAAGTTSGNLMAAAGGASIAGDLAA